MTDYQHNPVLLKEVIEYLNPTPGGVYFDATLGGGGYTNAILQKAGKKAQVIATDLDEASIENYTVQFSKFSEQVKLFHNNFAEIDKVIEKAGLGAPLGIVADIGFSSFQLDKSKRGISFEQNEPLDMRFDLSQRVTARFILEHKTEGELAKIFLDYGEEKLAKKIAKAIVVQRQSKSIKTTTDLSDLLKTTLKFLPPLKIKDVIRRIFQALRIAVNLELENLENFLPKAFDILKPGGVLVVVSFHSLEDRIVKQFFKGLTKGCVCPIEFPVCVCGKNPRGKILTNKPVVATQEELNNNPRSKPAKLRAIKKL